MGTGPLGFLANPQLSTDLVYLYQLPLSRASHAIPLSMMSCRGLMLGLKANVFLYPQLRNQMGTGPLEFLANPQLSTGLICLYQLPFESGSHVIPLSMMSCRGLMLGLRANIFLYPQPLEVLDYLVTLGNAMLPLGFHSVGELGIKEIDTTSARSWSEGLDQRCNVNLIVRRTLIKDNTSLGTCR